MNTDARKLDLEAIAGAWWLLLLFGIAGIIAGIIVLAEPGISIVTLAWVAGIFLLVDGAFELVASLSHRTESRGSLAILAVLSIIAGLILVRHPIAGVVAVALLLGIWFVASGLARFVEAFGRSERHRIWDMLLAGLELIAGIVIVADPGIGVGALAIIVGIAFIVRGIATAMVGWALRSAASAH